MSTPAPPPRPIFRRSPAYVGATPFEGDKLGRAALADHLTAYLARLAEGCVIGLDGEWGSGKSWFGKNWAAKLSASDYRTLYLDAFESDYMEDAFIVIASEILRATQGTTKRKLTKAVQGVAKAILPAATKAAVSAGLKFVGTSVEEIQEAIEGARDAAASSAEEFVKGRLKQYEEAQKGVAAFKSALTAFCAEQNKPVVFFIDELDRCKPSFAVQVIERIKHLFDVPGLVFVLLLNRKQLEYAIQGVYGGRVDAPAYLTKFIQFFLRLPSPVAQGGQLLRAFAWEVAARYSYPRQAWVEDFITTLVDMGEILVLTPRDVERIFVLFNLAHGVQQSSPLAAYLAALKLKKPDLFASLQRDGLEAADAHEEAANLTRALHKRNERFPMWPALTMLHSLHRKGWPDSLAAEQEESLQFFRNLNRDPRNALRWMIERLDLPSPD